MVSAIGATVVSSAILFLPIMNVVFMDTLLFLLGVCCGPHPLCFTLSKENCPHEISGTAVAFANFVIMMGGMLLQPTVGALLAMLGRLTTAPGTEVVYTNWDFSVALSVIPIGLIIAYFITLFIRETYNSQK